MRVVIFASSFYPAVKTGGPARALTNMAREAVAAGHDVVVIAPDRDLGDREPFKGLTGRWARVVGAEVYYVDKHSPRQVMTLMRRLSAQRPELIVLNSIWDATLSFLPALLCVAGVLRSDSVVLMPRGELEAGALALKSGKKSRAARLVKIVYGRAATHTGATSPSEKANLQLWFPDTPVIMSADSVDRIEAVHVPRGAGPLRVLFLGRIHPTKGLLPLIDALSHVTSPIKVTIAGPVGDVEYWDACQRAIASLPTNVSVEHVGTVGRDELPDVLGSSDLLVTLTAGENFGHTIGEALQAGCPVMLTPLTPWTDVVAAGGGAIVEDRNDSAAIATEIERWAGLADVELAASRGRAAAAFRSWSAKQPANVIDQVANFTRGVS